MMAKLRFFVDAAFLTCNEMIKASNNGLAVKTPKDMHVFVHVPRRWG